MIIIRADRAKAKAVNTELLTSGMVGPQVKFVFSNEWNGLNKTAVFRAGDVTIDVLDSQWNGNICTIPNECLATSGNTITVGIYGCNNDGDLIIPTVYARVGTVRVGANPYGDDNANPSLPVYEQIRSSIGKLSDLDTVDKSNLVAAINEAAKTADNIVTYTEQSLTDEQKAQVRENIGAVDIADLPTVYPHPITRIESLDKTNLIALRNLDSGTYVLYGYFKPFDGSTSTMTFGSNILVSIVKKTSESHVQIFYPNNNCVQYVKITDTSYERKNVYLNDLLSAVRFDEAQELTETQQEQARKNINAAEDGVQSDWLQNDPAAADYIKNRICYDESSTEEIEYVDTRRNGDYTHDLNMPLILGEKIRYEFYSKRGAISYAGSGIVTTDDNGTLMAIFTVPGDITEDTDHAVIKLYADHYVYAAGFYENAVQGFSKMVFIRSVPSTKIKTIDPKYLPVVGGYDIEASTTVTFEKSGNWYNLGTYSGASLGLEQFPVDAAPLNGRLPTKEELATAKNFGGNIRAPWSGDLQIIDIGDDNFALSPYPDPSYPTDLPVLMVVNSSVTINNVVIESGLYGGRLALSSDIILDITSFEMDVQTTEPKKIPAEYLDTGNLRFNVWVKTVSNEGYTFGCSHSYDELKAAFDAGWTLSGLYSGFTLTVLPLGDDASLMFSYGPESMEKFAPVPLSGWSILRIDPENTISIEPNFDVPVFVDYDCFLTGNLSFSDGYSIDNSYVLEVIGDLVNGYMIGAFPTITINGLDEDFWGTNSGLVGQPMYFAGIKNGNVVYRTLGNEVELLFSKNSYGVWSIASVKYTAPIASYSLATASNGVYMLKNEFGVTISATNAGFQDHDLNIIRYEGKNYYLTGNEAENVGSDGVVHFRSFNGGEIVVNCTISSYSINAKSAADFYIGSMVYEGGLWKHTYYTYDDAYQALRENGVIGFLKIIYMGTDFIGNPRLNYTGHINVESGTETLVFSTTALVDGVLKTFTLYWKNDSTVSHTVTTLATPAT